MKYLFVLVICMGLVCLNTHTCLAKISPPAAMADTTNAVMPDMVFWNIIDKARKKAKGDFGKQKVLLVDILKTLDPPSIVMFNNKFLSLIDAANYDKLYVAAQLIKPNCDEECFEDFKSWIIGQGKTVFFKMVSEPDNLSELDMETNSKWDGLQQCASDAYLDLNKEDIPVTFKRNTPITTMPKWGQDDKLVKKYLPKLFAKYN